jgi:DNA-directed RNA polymerase specialized sigma24 family protein
MSSNQNSCCVPSTDQEAWPPFEAGTTDAAPDAPANDNATVGGGPDTTPLLAHPDVVRYLRGTLRRYGVTAANMADAVADVQLRSLEAARARRMPADLGQWKALGATVAARWAVDRLREAEVHDKYDVGLCDDADAEEGLPQRRDDRDPIDTERYLAVLRELIDSGEMPEDGAEILSGEAERIPHAHIGAEVGLSRSAVRNRLQRMRAKFRARLAALGMIAVALLFLLAALLAPKRDVAAPARQELPELKRGADPAKNPLFPARSNRVLPD